MGEAGETMGREGLRGGRGEGKDVTGVKGGMGKL